MSGGERASLLRDDIENGADVEGNVTPSSKATHSYTGGRVALVSALSVVGVVCLGASAFASSSGAAQGWTPNSALGGFPKWLTGSDRAETLELGTQERRAPKMTTPMWIMGDAKEGSQDAQKIAAGYSWLTGLLRHHAGMSKEEVGQVINFQQATFPKRWPETYDVAQNAVSRIEKEKIPRIAFVQGAAFNNPEDCGRPCDDQLSHHTGCLLTHMAVWNRVLESDATHFVLWESDGSEHLSVSPLDYDQLYDELPHDADMVWMRYDVESSGQLLKLFKSLATGTWGGNLPSIRFDQEPDVYLYKFDKRCNWAGTPAYMMTRKGVEKIMNFINDAEKADMIDAWLANQCIKRCDDTKVCMGLNCYFASTQKVPKQKQGGYVPSWYDKPDYVQVREVDERIVRAMDDVAKYNALGCRHCDYTGFISTQFDGSFGVSDAKSTCDCYHTPQDGTFDVCNVKTKYPVSQKLRQSTLGGGGTAGGTRETILGSYTRSFVERMKLLGMSAGFGVGGSGATSKTE